MANIARESGVARTTVAGYLAILEETLMCFRLSAYEAKLRVRERKLPKWFWCDPGIVRAMKRSIGIPVPEERGALFEGLVAQLIRAYMDYRDVCEDMYYWAPSGPSATEVDFLLVRGTELIGVEAKSSNTFTDAWCKGLRAISELKGLRRRIIVYPHGPVLQTKDGIDVLPFQYFANQLADNSLWF